MSGYDVGHQPFCHIKPGIALKLLRVFLKYLKVPGARNYRTHDIRRGHAKDLQLSGATLGEILAAGEWSSPAFLKYLDMLELEAGVVMEAHVNESSSEEEDG